MFAIRRSLAGICAALAIAGGGAAWQLRTPGADAALGAPAPAAPERRADAGPRGNATVPPARCVPAV